jgi:hypothetical protein
MEIYDRTCVDKIVLFVNARDEPNMKEWVAHHLLIGFDYIFICDHKSKIPLQGQFNNFNKNGDRVFVTRSELNGPIKELFITRAVETAKKFNANWMLYLDADEFFVINTDKINNVKELLKMYPNADSVSFNWLMFGSNGHIKEPEGLIIDNYTKSQLKLCDHIKTFIRPSQFLKPNPHRCDIKTPSRMFHGNKTQLITRKEILHNNSVLFDNPIEYYNSIAYIAHYYVQSTESWIRRKLTLPRDDNGQIRPQNQTILNTEIIGVYDMHNDLNDVENVDVKNKYSQNIKNYLQSIDLC